jgi:hypothetical protein
MDLAAITVTSLPISLSVVGLVKGMRILVPSIDGRFVLIAAIAVAFLGGFALFAELPVLQRALIGVLVFGQAVGGVELVDRMGNKPKG